jgi:transcriptional regulator with XRE-family HTH domain
MAPTSFVERLQAHLTQINVQVERKKRVTAYKVAQEVGLDPTYVTNIFMGRKLGTPDTLARLGQSTLLKLSYETLRSWQALDQLEPDVIRLCADELSAADAVSDGGQHHLGDVSLKPVKQVSAWAPQPLALTVPSQWQLTAAGLVKHPVSDPHAEHTWDVTHIPTDVYPQLSGLYIRAMVLWPPFLQGTHVLVRQLEYPHILHPHRWYVVQLRDSASWTCQLVTYAAVPGRLIPVQFGQSVQVQTVLLADVSLDVVLEIIQYHVNLTSITV